MQELEAKFNITREQKALLQSAVAHDKIIYKIVEEPVSKLTGQEFPMGDTKVSVLKYDEDDVVRLLNRV